MRLFTIKKIKAGNPVVITIKSTLLLGWVYINLEIIHTGGEGDDRGWDGWMASPT